MNSKNLSKAINRMLAILLTAAMVAGSFTVPAKADEIDDVIEQTSEPVEEVNTASAEISEEGDEPASNDMVVKDPYPYDVEITVPDFVKVASTTYGFKKIGLKADLLDKIEIKSKNGGDTLVDISAASSAEMKMTQDVYKTDGSVDTVNDYSILVYRYPSSVETLYTSTERGADGTDMKAAGKYKLVIDIHDHLGRWNAHEEYEWEITKYPLSDFFEFLNVTWESDDSEVGPFFTGTSSTSTPANVDGSTVKVAFPSADADYEKIKSAFLAKFPKLNGDDTAITDAIAAIKADLNTTNTSGNHNFLEKKTVVEAESDISPKPDPVPDGYLWNTAGDSLKVAKNTTADSDKPHVTVGKYDSYAPTTAGSSLADFIETAGNSNILSKAFNIRKARMANGVSLITSANATKLKGGTVGNNIETTESDTAEVQKAAFTITVDVDKTKMSNDYAFDLKDYFEKLDGTGTGAYSELESLSGAIQNDFFRTGSVKAEGTTLKFSISGKSYEAPSSNNNDIVVMANYSNYQPIELTITIERETKEADSISDIKWVGKTETTQGGLKLPYLSTGYLVGIAKKDGTTDTLFGVAAGNGNALSNNVSYQYQKALSNGVWGKLADWNAATDIQSLGTYRILAKYDLNGDSSTYKYAYSSPFEVVPAELTVLSTTNTNISNGSAKYSINVSSGTDSGKVNILTNNGALKFTSNAYDYSNTKYEDNINLGTLDTNYTIEYKNVTGAYTFADVEDPVVDSSIDYKNVNVCHLVSGPQAGKVYVGQPYAIIVSKNSNYSTKPLYVTFDLKTNKDSLLTVSATTQTINRPAALNEEYVVDLPADMFYYTVDTNKIAIDPADVTTLSVAVTSASSAVVETGNNKPTITKTAKGYQLKFVTSSSSCATGDSAVFTITPEFGWPYKNNFSGTTNNNNKPVVTVNFKNICTIAIKEDHKTFSDKDIKTSLINSTSSATNSAVPSYIIKINGIVDKSATAVSGAVYAEATSATTDANKLVYDGVTYDKGTDVSSVEAAGKYLVKVTGVTYSGSTTVLDEDVYIPFVIDKYELTEDDITVNSTVINENLRAATNNYTALKTDLAASTSATAPQTNIQLVTSFDGTARAIGADTPGSSVKLTRDENATLSSRAADTYCISVAGPTNVDTDTFKYDVTFKLNENAANNYTMAAAGIKKTITVKKVDVSIKSGTDEATAAGYSVAATARTLGSNGMVTIGANTNWYYDGYEKNPVVNDVTITVTNTKVGTASDNSTPTYKKTIKANKGVTYGENTKVGAASIMVDFSDEIEYKGIVTDASAFTILQRIDSTAPIEKKSIEVEVPAAAGTTVVQLPLGEYDVTSGKGILDTKATAASYTVKSSTGIPAGTGVTGTYEVTAQGLMTITTTAAPEGKTSGVIKLEPVFAEYSSATNMLEVTIKAVNKSVLKITGTESNTAIKGKTYDGKPAELKQSDVLLSTSGEYTDGRTTTEKGVTVSMQWYASNGTTVLTEAPKNAGEYKVKVSIDKNDKYMSSDTFLTYTINPAVATVKELTEHLIYNGANQADALVKGIAGEELTAGATGDYTITVYRDPTDKIKDISTIDAGLVTATYKNVGTYKLEVVGNYDGTPDDHKNYVIREDKDGNNATTNTGVIVKCYIDKADLTIAPKTGLVQYADESPKTYALGDPAAPLTSPVGIATVTGLATGETVAISGSIKTDLDSLAYNKNGDGTPYTKTLTVDDLAFTGGSDENYNIKFEPSGTFSIEFKKRPVKVDIKLYDSEGKEITSAIPTTGKVISVDYRVSVADPILTPAISLTEGTNYEVVIPSGIKEAGTYEIKVKNIDEATNVYDIEEKTVELVVSDPEAIEVNAAIKVGTSAIKNDGTSQIGKSDTARQVTAAVTDKKSGTVLTEGEDYTITVVKKGTTAPAEVLDLGKYTVTIESTNKTYSFETITVDFEIIETVIVVESISDVKADTSSLKPGDSATVTYKVTGTENGEAADLTDKVTVNVASEKGAEGNFTYSSTSGSSPITVTAKAGAVAGDKETFTISYVEGEETVKGTFVLRIKAESGDVGPSAPDDEVNEYRKPGEEEIKDAGGKGGIASVTINSKKVSYPYTGKAIEPKVTVKDDSGAKLVENTDYKVYYKDNVNASSETDEAKVVVYGINDYAGNKEAGFTIAAKDVKKLKYVLGTCIVEDGSVVGYDISVYDGTTYLAEDENYEVVAPDTVASGAKKVEFTIKAIDGTNYTGSVNKSLAISTGTTPINGCNVELKEEDEFFKFDGKAKKPEVVVTDDAGTVDPKNYSVSYTNNKKVGTATITIKGKKDYAGTKVVPFEITESDKQITADNIVLTSKKDYVYTGKLIKAAVKVTNPSDTKKTLKKGTDYLVYYKNELNASDPDDKTTWAKVVIIGIGDYAGQSDEKEFEIKPAEITKAKFTATKKKASVLEFNKKKLYAGTDFEVVVAKGTKDGTYTLTFSAVEGGNFKAGSGRTATLVKKNVKKEFINWDNLGNPEMPE